MSGYEIIRLNQSKYECLFVTTSFQDPFKSIHSIESGLKECKVEGYVLFDLLAQIGDNSERFMDAYFNGECFDISSFQFVDISKKSSFRKMTMDYFHEHLFILEDTILTNLQKKMIANGIAI